LIEFINHSPKAFPIPNAAPAEIAPITSVYKLDQYHFTLVTKLLPNPSTNKKKAETKITAIKYYLPGVSTSWVLATIIGIKGIKPNMQKLKKVIRLFLIGFSSPEIICNYSIIMTFKNPSLFCTKISTI
jgi:hypothetical protein